MRAQRMPEHERAPEIATASWSIAVLHPDFEGRRNDLQPAIPALQAAPPYIIPS